MTHYSSLDSVEARYVRPALGGYADDFDVTAIAREVVEYRRDPHPYRPGDEYANGYYAIRDDVDFWAVAQEHYKPL